MRRALRIVLVLALLAVILFAVWEARALHHQRSRQSALAVVRSALTNPVEFAKSRVTGGIGLILRTDVPTGLPIVQGVGVGSPAEAAGLRPGDLILRVDGVPTTNRPFKLIVDEIHGFTGARTILTLQRNRATNFDCEIRRASWNTLRGLSFKQD